MTISKELLKLMRDHAASTYSRKKDPALEDIDPAALVANLADAGGGAAAGVERRLGAERWQDKVIEYEIPEGASVLDLGCGEGKLLERLMMNKRIMAQGLELDAESVVSCVERGVPVFQADLDDGLRGFPDDSFDYVILEETLPTLRQPMRVLSEMLRVGRRGIISFPNFGYWRVRLDLLIEGRMPVTDRLPDPWHGTENIRLFTFRDLTDWAEKEEVEFERGFAIYNDTVRELQDRDNLLAEEVLVILKRKKGD